MEPGTHPDVETLDIRAPGAVRRPDSELPLGSSVDRYVILGTLGKGGMGAVYSAYDPQLDRRIALKFLRTRLGGTEAMLWQARLAREAQAMARLSHPNVVTVYDSGVTADGRVFLAMESVEGGTLVAWLKERKRSWREIVSVFCEAGEGLAAAHRAGVIHRDFKLDNVLIGSDGRPRVTDFGLARATENEPSGARVRVAKGVADPIVIPVALPSSTASLAEPLTLTGTLLGTPGYMAPEQYGVDEEIDARADIFSFCATMCRALYGERAFEGDTVEALASATIQGRVRPAPKGTDVPVWLRRVLLRGLAAERSMRPDSMHDLLTALRADPAKRRRRWLALAGVATALCVLVGSVAAVGQRSVRVCRGMADGLGGVWDGSRKAAIERAFRATRLGYASDTWLKVERSLDAYAASWATSTEQACLATRVRGEQSEAMLDLRSACLDERRDELKALSDMLVSADAKTIENSIQATHALSPLEQCANLDRLSLSARLPIDPTARREIRSLQADVAAAKAMSEGGKELQSLERLRQIQHRAEATGYGPLLVSWRLSVARAETAGEAKTAAEDFQQAALLADAHRLDAQRADALIELSNEARLLAKFEDSHRWTLLATAAIERMGGDATLEVKRDVREGWAYGCGNEYARAATLFERALVRAQEAHLDDPRIMADAHSGLADAFSAQGRFEESLEHMSISLRIVEEAYGPLHPAVAVQTTNLAGTYLNIGRTDEAFATATRAVEMLEAAVQRGDISASSGSRGDAAETLGATLLRIGRPNDAVAQLSRARDIFRAGSAQDDLVALADNGLAEALRNLGRQADAMQALDEATEIEVKVNGIASETVATTLVLRAKVALEQGKTADALAIAERAVAQLASGEPEPYDLAEGRLILAKALKRSGRDAPRARLLAEQAREAFGRVHDSRSADEAAALLAALD